MDALANRSDMGVVMTLGGSAKVYCVHDREKRQVPDPDTARELARMAGMTVAPYAKFQTCACCVNAFATFDDTPRLCDTCSGQNVHALGGPLSEPLEGVL